MDKNREKITSKFESILRPNRLFKKNALVMLCTNYKTYYINRRQENKNLVWCKMMMLYLFCYHKMSKENSKKVLDIMNDKDKWMEKGLKWLKKD